MVNEGLSDGDVGREGQEGLDEFVGNRGEALELGNNHDQAATWVNMDSKGAVLNHERPRLVECDALGELHCANDGASRPRIVPALIENS
mgnify:FL=1